MPRIGYGCPVLAYHSWNPILGLLVYYAYLRMDVYCSCHSRGCLIGMDG